MLLLSSQHLKGKGYMSLAREVTREFNILLKHAKTRKQRDMKNVRGQKIVNHELK